MCESDTYFLSGVVDIPLETKTPQSDTEDPRQINQFCLALHERRKQFLSKNTVPHKLLKSDFEEVYHYVVHSNIHNYEITANPRNTPFFSLHGPKYDDVAQFFDPRRTKTCDILGDTIYQKQVFIDVSEEIPTTNDVFFENLISNYQTPGISDLLPIILDQINITKEEGEVTKTINSSLLKEPDESLRTRVPDDLDAYRDLLIDLLVTKNQIKMKDTLKSSPLIQKIFKEKQNYSKLNCKEDRPHSFVDEKSVLGDKSLPTETNISTKTSAFSKLATDPDLSFVDEFERSEPQSTSTPNSKQKKTTSCQENPNTKFLFKVISEKQLRKSSTVEQNTVIGQVTNKENRHTNKRCSAYDSNSFLVERKKMTRKFQKVDHPKFVNDKHFIQSQALAAAHEDSTSIDASKRLENDGDDIQKDLKCQIKSFSRNGCDNKPVGLNTATARHIASKLTENKVQEQFPYTETKSQKLELSKLIIGQEIEPSTESQKVETFTETDNHVLAPSTKDVTHPSHTLEPPAATIPDKPCSDVHTDKNEPELPTPAAHAVSLPPQYNSKSTQQNTGDCQERDTPDDNACKTKKRDRSSLLETSIMSIKALKGTSDQLFSFSSNLNVEVAPLTRDVSPQRQELSIDYNHEKLKKLSFKDREMTLHLSKFCTCWVEVTKHPACVEHYGEFLVVINNRYSEPLDMETINSALSALNNLSKGHNSSQILGDNLFLRTALFTSELLKIIKQDIRGTDP